jgi:hypothetical protein
MNTQASRRIRLGLVALVALISALAALAVSNGSDAHAHDTASVADVSAKELKLRSDMRVLWEDHVTWTRLAVISLVGGTPDTEATVARLLRNQTDIGNAVKPFYGTAAGNALTGELRKHILIAADVIAAAKSGNKAELTRQQALWQRNADDIAVLLSKANPRFWKRPALKAMLLQHLGLTTGEVVARLEERWTDEVAAYDRVHRHALGMADALSTGIVKQFPRRFA